MELLLARVPSQKTCTIGALINLETLKRECYILEDVVREIAGKPVQSWKVAGKTAIPAGRYRIAWSYSPRFKKFTPELIGVPGFTGIRIHAGNTGSHTEGCLLPGTSIDAGGEAVLGSIIARDALCTKIEAEIAGVRQVFITIL